MPNDEKRNRVGIPEFRVPSKIELRFFRDVGIPNQKELGKRDVSPEDDKRKHELTHEMVMLHRDDVLEIPHLPETRDKKDQNPHRI